MSSRLMMANGPDYLAGLARHHAHRRGIVALINTQLIGDSLAHAINVVAPRHVIVGAEFAAAFTAGAAPHRRRRFSVGLMARA